MRIVWEYLSFVADNALTRLEGRNTARWSARPASVNLAPVRFLEHAPKFHRELLTIIAVCVPLLTGFAIQTLMR
jgi:hypothetical protein